MVGDVAEGGGAVRAQNVVGEQGFFGRIAQVVLEGIYRAHGQKQFALAVFRHEYGHFEAGVECFEFGLADVGQAGDGVDVHRAVDADGCKIGFVFDVCKIEAENLRVAHEVAHGQ